MASDGLQPFGVSWVDDLRYCLAGRAITVAIDVGAHRGETTELIAREFPSARIHAFEPVRPSFRALTHPARDLDARLVNAAVSSHDGRARFHLGPDSGRYAHEEHIERIDLLEIDAEGHEPEVLRGATQLLRDGRVEFVLAECEFTERVDEPHGDFATIMRHLLPHGFRIVSFYTGGVDAHGWRWGDVLLRLVTEPDTGWVATSPHERGA